jgi:hypothetical protein
VIGLVAVAVVLRLIVIAALFLHTDHALVPFGTFFGDEDYYIKRSLWLRNVALGIPIHSFDLEYAFEPNGRSGFLYVLAFVQTLTGAAPYGVRLVNVAFFIGAALLLYRAVRTRFGRVAALCGLAVLLFLPTLVIWSLSVIKEPLFILLSGSALVLARIVVSPTAWNRRIASAAGLVVVALLLQAVRNDGAVFVAAASVVGVMAGSVASRPRLLIAAIASVPILAGAVMRAPEVQLQTYAAVERAARQHWGAVVVTRGFGYKLLDERFYPDLNSISSLDFGETVRFLARGVTSYVVRPLPWDAKSAAAAAYIPEQIVWYALAALALIGAARGWRRDPMLTGLLVAYTLLVAAASAFTDGNIGTLVRHRDLALPFIAWLSGVGGCELITMGGRVPWRAPSTPLTPDRLGLRTA